MTRSLLALLVAFVSVGCARAPPMRAWGASELALIEQAFALHGADEGLYFDRVGSDQSASAWSMGVQLTALTAVGEPARLRRVIDAMDAYRREDDSHLGGYCASPRSMGNLDRYYDDNAWIALGLIEAYRITGDPRDLERAKRTLNFVLSGEDQTLDGGIWWHETNRKSKNACSNAPAIVACLALDQVLGTDNDLKLAIQLHDWTDSRLRDRDRLYFDNINLDGEVERTKWSYNTAMMIRAKCMLFDVSRDESYLDDARLTALAAEQHWIDPQNGAIKDDSQFAHLLAEAFLEVAS